MLAGADWIDRSTWAESWHILEDARRCWPNDGLLRDMHTTLAIAQAIHRQQWADADALWNQAEASVADVEAVAELWGWYAVLAAHAGGGPEVLNPLWDHLDRHPNMGLAVRLESLRHAYDLAVACGWDIAWPLLWVLRQAYHRYHAEGWLQRYPWPVGTAPASVSIAACDRMIPWIEVSTPGPAVWGRGGIA